MDPNLGLIVALLSFFGFLAFLFTVALVFWCCRNRSRSNYGAAFDSTKENAATRAIAQAAIDEVARVADHQGYQDGEIIALRQYSVRNHRQINRLGRRLGRYIGITEVADNAALAVGALIGLFTAWLIRHFVPGTKFDLSVAGHQLLSSAAWNYWLIVFAWYAFFALAFAALAGFFTSRSNANQVTRPNQAANQQGH